MLRIDAFAVEMRWVVILLIFGAAAFAIQRVHAFCQKVYPEFSDQINRRFLDVLQLFTPSKSEMPAPSPQ